MILGITIKNYNPLLKKGVSLLELNTDEVLNIVIGRNGFGKTSLLRVCDPLPPDNADFSQGGFKEWRYKDDRGTYILRSTTGKSSKHEFIYNGVNLNEGNTLLVQRELVKIHFGLTPAIRNVLSGLDVRDLFTTMSSARRKEFLMLVNPNDTTYVLNVYDKLRSNYNTIKGGLKTLRAKLITEESRAKQLASMSPEELQRELSQMDDQIKNALLIHGQLTHVEQEDIKGHKDKIAAIISRLMGNNPKIKNTKNGYSMALRDMHSNLDMANKRNARLGTILSEVTIQLQGFGNNSMSLEGYQSRLEMVETQLEIFTEEMNTYAEQFKNIPFFLNDEYYRSEQLNRIGNELVDQIQQVHRARSQDITSEIFRETQEKLVHTNNEIGNIERDITECNHVLQHFSKAESVDCPKCEHTFKLGFEKFDPESIELKRDQLVTRKESLKEKAKKLSDFIEANEDWYGSMGGFVRYIRRQDNNAKLFDMVTEYGIGKSDVAVLIDTIRKAGRFSELEQQVKQLKAELEQVKAQIDFLTSSDIHTLFLRAEDLERELAITQRQILSYRTHIQELNELIDVVTQDEYDREMLESLMAELDERIQNNGKFKIKLRVQEIISDLTPRKDQLLGNLIRAESLNSVINSIKENIADLERKEKHTQLLLDGLSPVKGFIGYLMNDFLKSVIANMNAIIQPVWSNRLHVLNCTPSKSEEDVDLSYMFPVVSGDSDKTNKDIAECSGGEREIINFAFRLVILRYLGVHCAMPLNMDEVGVAFDELNRSNFNTFLKEQMRLDKLPQTFLISHSYKEYASHGSANIIALNTEGLNIGFKVNQKSIIR